MAMGDGSGRDARGRWLKGFCPNLKGRPRKPPEISDADVGWFKQQVVEVSLNGEKRQLTRHELLLHSMFEQAIKGKSAALARKLFDRFDEVDMLWARVQDDLKTDREAFLEDYHQHGKFDAKRANAILELSEMLSYGRKPKGKRKPRCRSKSRFANWRKRPKPQSLLDLEAQEEAEILAEERERARRLGLDIDPEDGREGGDGA